MIKDKELLKKKLDSRIDYWAKQLSEVQYLRRDGGNWFIQRENQNAPTKVKGYIKDRKARVRKCQQRLKNLFQLMKGLEA